MTVPLETVATFVALTLLTLGMLILKSYNDGHLRSWLDNRQAEKEHGEEQMDEIGDSLQEIKQEVHSVKQTTEQTRRDVKDVRTAQERMGEIMVQLHEDEDDVDGEELRDQLDVEDMPGDIWRGGDAAPDGGFGASSQDNR